MKKSMQFTLTSRNNAGSGNNAETSRQVPDQEIIRMNMKIENNIRKWPSVRHFLFLLHHTHHASCFYQLFTSWKLCLLKLTPWIQFYLLSIQKKILRNDPPVTTMWATACVLVVWRRRILRARVFVELPDVTCNSNISHNTFCSWPLARTFFHHYKIITHLISLQWRSKPWESKNTWQKIRFSAMNYTVVLETMGNTKGLNCDRLRIGLTLRQ